MMWHIFRTSDVLKDLEKKPEALSPEEFARVFKYL
uniref:Uncharacterized protein n=1 Tax=Candidatus Methanophaga sp. ANME-1 ERB7 TaxID=2759913 RepID=A0A7G9ZA57_9EURY|nr:hypothetical protein BDIJAAHH_00014 [Methanosarcinales archaeon ANME-1 ERB7]